MTSLGTEGLVIVETPDAVFVAPKSESQRVKDVVAELNERSTEAASHQKVYRPWGTFESLIQGIARVKRLTVNRARRCRCSCITTAPNIGWWCAAQRV